LPLGVLGAATGRLDINYIEEGDVNMDIDWPVSNADFKRIADGEIIEIVNQNNIEEEFYTFACNFNKSAHMLTEYILEDPRIERLDFYFFSLAYLYRHSIELILKAIGFKYIVDIDDRKAFLKDTFHNLAKILVAITPFIQSHFDSNRYCSLHCQYLKGACHLSKNGNEFLIKSSSAML
jgi:hypothetical protein